MMTLATYLDKSSIQLLVAESGDGNKPVAIGTAFLIIHNSRLILITLAHVADYDGTLKLIKYKDLRDENGGFSYYHLGGMVFHDVYDKNEENEKYDKVDIIDFAFVEIKDINVRKYLQNKYIRYILSETLKPSTGLIYFFKGFVQYKFENDNKLLNSEVLIEEAMSFLAEIDGFLIFQTRKIIKDAIDYKGCSGAPVVDKNGGLVGVVAEVVPNTKFIKVFPLHKGQELIKQSIETKLL